jgi:hypothetical protein
MNRVGMLLAAMVIGVATADRTADAQDVAPPISGFVVDLHGMVPRFSDDPELAASRGITQGELPGSGIGFTAGGHVYVARIAAVTIGAGAEFAAARSSAAPDVVAGQTSTLRPVTETFTAVSPQLSLNFGHRNGWSYLSGGISLVKWSVVPDGKAPMPIDEERRRTISYGGGARWFARQRLAFSVDVRFYDLPAGSPQPGVTASPRTRLIVIGAGISVR